MAEDSTVQESEGLEGKKEKVAKDFFEFRNYKKNIICIAVLLLIIISWVEIIDKKTENYIDNALVTAVGAFATARGLNATISVFKTTEVGYGGVLSSAVGSVLDPLDDMVEDFSTIMKISLASLTIQKIIIEITSSNVFKILLGIMGLIFIATLQFGPNWLIPWFFKGFLSVGLIRFLLIIVLVGSALANSAFLEEKTERGAANLLSQEKKLKAAEKEMNLSAEEQARLQEKLDNNLNRQKDMVNQIENVSQSLQKSRIELEKAEKKLEEMSEKRSTMDKLNFMSNDPEYNSAKKARDLAAEKVEKWNDKLEALSNKLEEIKMVINETKAILQGETDESFTGKLKSKIDSIKNALSADNLMQIAQDLTDACIRLIALFIFQTIILPLFFLYICIKGSEKIWKVNILDKIRDKSAEGKKRLAEMRSSSIEKA